MNSDIDDRLQNVQDERYMYLSAIIDRLLEAQEVIAVTCLEQDALGVKHRKAQRFLETSLNDLQTLANMNYRAFHTEDRSSGILNFNKYPISPDLRARMEKIKIRNQKKKGK